MFLGLTPDAASFDDSLVQALDITRNPAIMSRDVSSKAANVLTMLVKGADPSFTPTFAAQYALEVEDMFSMHFLDMQKKAIVDTMIVGLRLGRHGVQHKIEHNTRHANGWLV